MTPPTVHIRPLAATDFAGFVALLTRFYEYANNPIPPSSAIRELFDVALDRSRNFHVVGAVSEDELVGMISVTFAESSYRTAPFAWCDDLMVLPSQRGQGIGKRLLRAVAELAREAGCSNVLLGVGESDSRAQRFYRAQGFVDLRNRLFSLPLGDPA